MIDSHPVALVGGRGYLGSALAALLRRDEVPFWIVGRQSAAEAAGEGPYRSAIPDLTASLAGARSVVHLASVSTPALGHVDPLLDVENLRFTVQLLAACRAARVGHVVFLSSGGTVYGEASAPLAEDSPTRPACSYGLGKLAAEHYMRLFSGETEIPVTVLRVSNAYGGPQRTKGQQGVVSHLIRALRRDGRVSLFGDTVRDYIHVDDVVSAVRAALTRPSGQLVLNVSTGIGVPLVKLTEHLAGRLAVTPRIEVGQRRPFDVAYNVLRNERARAALGWTPAVSLDEGLSRAIEET